MSPLNVDYCKGVGCLCLLCPNTKQTTSWSPSPPAVSRTWLLDDSTQIHSPGVAPKLWAHSQWASRVNHINHYSQTALNPRTSGDALPPLQLSLTCYKGNSWEEWRNHGFWNPRALGSILPVSLFLPFGVWEILDCTYIPCGLFGDIMQIFLSYDKNSKVVWTEKLCHGAALVAQR